MIYSCCGSPFADGRIGSTTYVLYLEPPRFPRRASREWTLRGLDRPYANGDQCFPKSRPGRRRSEDDAIPKQARSFFQIAPPK